MDFNSSLNSPTTPKISITPNKESITSCFMGCYQILGSGSITKIEKSRPTSQIIKNGIERNSHIPA
jgi:hypothetical protein